MDGSIYEVEESIIVEVAAILFIIQEIINTFADDANLTQLYATLCTRYTTKACIHLLLCKANNLFPFPAQTEIRYFLESIVQLLSTATGAWNG